MPVSVTLEFAILVIFKVLNVYAISYDKGMSSGGRNCMSCHYRRHPGINSFFWISGIYDACATGQLHIKNSMVERSRSSSFVQPMFINVYVITKKNKNLSEGEELVESVN